MSYTTARRASAIATSLVAFISYLLSVAPSVTFWRASELAAASSVFGIPEPPASPLWLIVARVAAFVIPGDAAGAAAIFSAICSAATAGLVVLIVCALVERWFDTDDDDAIVPAIGGGVVAALAFAWGDSQWRAATMASIEPFAVLLVAASLLLTLRWSKHAGEPSHAGYLLATAFVLGLLGGVDTRLLAIAPALGAIVYFRTVEPTPWNAGVAVAIALVAGWAFDRLATTWLPAVLDGSSWFVIIGAPAILAILFGAWRATRDDTDNAVGVAALACLLALAGASTVLVIPIRGASHPPTNAYSSDVDAPVERAVGVDAGSDVPFWPRRWSIDPERRRYQDRYGAWTPAAIDDPLEASVGAELRFFWHYQLAHMYLRYVLWNYVGRATDHPEAPPAWFEADQSLQEVQQTDAVATEFPVRFFALPLLLALIGFIMHMRRDPRMSVALALLFVLSGIGVVLSISLQQPQPRERDSLFLASYFVVALWIGIASAALAARKSKVDDDAVATTTTTSASRGLGVAAIVVCALAGPVNMLVGGWSTHDRSASIIAWDYAYNLLQSCDSNAVLLTAGDNDTFPLMYLQNAEGIRRDVLVVNLSMANDPAYLRRVARDRRWSDAPIPLSIIDTLSHDAHSIGVEVGPPPTISIALAADLPSIAADSTREPTMTWVLRGPSVGGEGMQMLRLQEHVIVDLLRQNHWKRPIYFASSVASSDRAGLDAFLRREGLALRIMPQRQVRVNGEAVDTARTRRALLNPVEGDDRFEMPHAGFKLRGLSSASSYLEPEERRVISLYRHLYLVLAEQEMSSANGAAAVRTLLDAMERRIPSSVHPMPYWMSSGIASLYSRAGATKEARHAAMRAVDAVDAMGTEWRRHPHARAFHPIQVKAQMLALLDDYDRAIETYAALQAKYPTDPHLRGQLEELRIERHLAHRDTTGALTEIDAIIAAYVGNTEPSMQNNASAFRELADELRGIDADDEATPPTKRRRK